jgi:hypothetical protein
VRTAALLALVLRAWEAPSGRALHAYAWDRALVDAAAPAASWLERAGAALAAPSADRRELLAALGPAAPTLLALGSALATTGGEPVAPWRRLARQWRRADGQLPPSPLLGGAEIAAITGLAPGPALGRAVAALARAQTRGDVRGVAAARRWVASRCAR